MWACVCVVCLLNAKRFYLIEMKEKKMVEECSSACELKIPHWIQSGIVFIFAFLALFTIVFHFSLFFLNEAQNNNDNMLGIYLFTGTAHNCSCLLHCLYALQLHDKWYTYSGFKFSSRLLIVLPRKVISLRRHQWMFRK